MTAPRAEKQMHYEIDLACDRAKFELQKLAGRETERMNRVRVTGGNDVE